MTSESSRQQYWRTLRDNELRSIEEAAMDFNYTPHARGICYEDAVAIALRNQTENRRWFVCGSLALMLTGVMKPGEVSDIDFVTNQFPDDRKFYTDKRIKYHNQTTDKDSYYHCEVSQFVDLFIHKRPISTASQRYRGLILQNIQDVIKWKRSFGRDKDQNDLMQIHLDDSLFEI